MSDSARRALVTGGAGFLGSHLCDRLLASGYDVVAVDDLSTGRDENLATALELPPERFRLLHDDVSTWFRRDPAFIRADVGTCDLVCHLASRASPVAYRAARIDTLRAGAAATDALLTYSSLVGARFLLASTSEVYGDPTEHPQTEAYRGNVDPVGPRSCYDESKRYAEALTVAFAFERQADVRIARIFNTYGPRMRADDGRAVPAFIRAALAGAPIPVAGDGQQTRSLCYVDDLIDGLVRLATAPRSPDLAQPINLGSPFEVTVEALAREVRDAVWAAAMSARGRPESPIEFGPAAADDPRRRRPDITRAQRLLGWSPTIPRADGLDRTVRWFVARAAGARP